MYNTLLKHLSETQRIIILIFVGCGDKTRTQQEVCNLFNAKHFSRSTISKFEKKFRETGHIRHIINAGYLKINENLKFNVFLNVKENFHNTSREIAVDNIMSQW